MTISYRWAQSDGQIVTYIKSSITKILHQTTSSSRYNNIITFALHRERMCNKKEQFLRGKFWPRARQRDVLTDRISFGRVKNYFERLAVNG